MSHAQSPGALPAPLYVVYDSIQPEVSETAWVASGAILIGAVTIGARSSVWYTAVLRADSDRIAIGTDTNVQDGVVVHTDPGFPVRIGDRVTVGHRATLHGCTVEHDVLVGAGAVVLNGAIVGCGSLIAAGSVVLERTVIPPASLVAGVPGRVRRPLTEAEVATHRDNATAYLRLAGQHAASH